MPQLHLDMAELVEHYKTIPRFSPCGGTCGGSLFEGEGPRHTMVEGRWPTSLDKGRGMAGGELGGGFVGILVGR